MRACLWTYELVQVVRVVLPELGLLGDGDTLDMLRMPKTTVQVLWEPLHRRLSHTFLGLRTQAYRESRIKTAMELNRGPDGSGAPDCCMRWLNRFHNRQP